MNEKIKKIKIKCVHMELMDIDLLKPHPENLNVHPLEQIRLLAEIIKEQGWRSPIVVSNKSGFITRGHARLEAAKILKQKVVPVDVQNYKSEAEELADLVADNKIGELSTLDKNLLPGLLKRIREKMPNIEVTGFTVDQFDALVNKQKAVKPDVEFTEELMESSNYVVLYFDNQIDWLQALTLFNLKTVKALDSKEGFQKQGIGRVIDGVRAIDKLIGGGS